MNASPGLNRGGHPLLQFGTFLQVKHFLRGGGTHGTSNGFCLTLRPIQLITEICIFGHAVRHRGKAFAQCIPG
jgi:hypothetical protein